MQNEPRKARRTANACIACRQSKIKCSGEEPCQNCQRRCLQCRFAEGGTKVVVSEKYLQDLQKQIEEHRRSPSSSNFTPDMQQAGYQMQPQPSPSSLSQTQTRIQTPLQAQVQGQCTLQTMLEQPQIQIDPQVESQYQSLREPSAAASVAASITAAQTHLSTSSYYSPPNLSQQAHSNDFSPRVNISPRVNLSPHIGSKRTSEAAFGGSTSNLGSECRVDTVDTTLASPALTIDGVQQPAVTSEPSRLSTFQTAGNDNLSVWPSALSIPSKIITNTQQNKRTWIWLAPWSTWSFTARLMLMLDEALHPGTPLLPPQLLETDSYDLKWKSASPSENPNIHGLPSLEHAIYLLNTFRFYIGQPYRLFDEDEFEREIRQFYSNAAYRAAEYRLWYLKFLLILSFGTAFLARPTHSQEPPGSQFFKRAMALMPDNRALWKESLLAIQVLALVGLYLFSIDEREAGHVYLGQAIRIAQMEGLHTQLPEEELGTETVTRCRNLWWTLYIMDRHFSCSVGLPMSVKDSEITTKINPMNTGSQGDMARGLQVNLSHLLSVTLTTLYKPEKTPLGAFLEQTRSILHTLAHHAQEIEKIIRLKFENSVETMPRDTTYITLMYHQCVIVATRPLLLSVLKERLDIIGHPRDENWESFLAQTATVISTGIKSAIKTLEIMSSEYSVLEVFLPYELEFTFGAALHLVMANTLFPDDHGCHHLVHPILDDMIARGKRVAEKRKRELVYLENLCQELSARIQQEGLQTLSLAVPEETASEAARHLSEERRRTMGVGENEEQHLQLDPDAMSAMNQPIHPHLGSNIDFLDNIGISSEDFLSIVHQIGDPDTLPEGVLTLD